MLELLSRATSVASGQSLITGIAPHALTTRISITVPTGYVAFVNVLHTGLVRDAAPTVPGTARAYVDVVASGVGTVNALYASDYSTAIGSNQLRASNGLLWLWSGDAINCKDEDLSTGGSYTYVHSAQIVYTR